MEKTLVNFVKFLTVFVCWQNGYGRALKLEIDPPITKDIILLLPSDIRLSCTVDSSDCQVKEIVVLEILHPNRKPIAVLRQNSAISIGVGMERDFQATGKISTNVSKSYIDVTLTRPRKEDSGMYTCVMYYLNDIGILKEMRENASLSLNSRDLTTVLQNMMEKITDLESELVEQRNESRGKETLLEKITNLEEELIKQKNKSEINEILLKKQITLLQTKVEDKEKEMMRNVHVLEIELNELKNESNIKDAELEKMSKHCVAKENMQKEVAMLESKIENNEQEIVKNVSGLESQLEVQTTQSLQMEKHLKDQMAIFQTKISEQYEFFTNSTEILKEQLKHQGLNLQQITEKELYRVAFSVGYTKAIKLSRGDNMIFDDVIMSEGQGYSTKTGIFTAPRAGFYFFHLSLSIRSVNWIDVELRANGRALGRLFVGDNSWDQQSSVSCVAKLEAGDKVNPVVFSISSTSFAANALLLNKYGTFSGYLLNAL